EVFFFFQAEDGIRDWSVTGVQTCALPISPALLVNERAVGTDQNKRYVIVVDGDNKAAWREVTLGPSINGLRVVSSGLSAGERIVDRKSGRVGKEWGGRGRQEQ